jgi:lipoate---protein ligase
MKYVDLSKYGRQEDPFFFALETELLKHLESDLFFIWHVYGAVIIGKHQLIDTEVNKDYLNDQQIKVFRRLSGGGAVYSDEGCIKYSFLSKNFDKEKVFKSSLEKIKHVFDQLGVQTEISGRNDILFDGKKFSGNAYYRNQYGSCLHGTILFDTDFEKLVKSITPSNDKLISKGIESVRSRVVNLKPYLSLDQPSLEKYIEETLCDGVYHLSSEIEKAVFEQMAIYHDKTFIEGYNPNYEFNHKKRFAGGTLGLKLSIKKNLIEDVIFYGDYFLNEEPTLIQSRLLKQPFINLDIRTLLKDIQVGDYFLNITNEDFYSLLEDNDGNEKNLSTR